MRIALFSDVHGHLRLLLHVVRNWQVAHSSFFDGILVAGDLGCFPDLSKSDRSTQRWIENDPEEAGFSHYFTAPHPKIAEFHGELSNYSTVRSPILFVAGNHEDHDYLQIAATKDPAPNSPENTFPVDCYRQIHCIRDGSIARIQAGGQTLSVGGLWGVENTRPNAPYQIKPAAVQKLQKSGRGSFAFLLTHDAPAGAYPTGGSEQISAVIATCSPLFHLFGHVPQIHGEHQFQLPNQPTKSIRLKDLSFGRNGEEGLVGAMAILEWTDKESSLHIVKDEWLAQMRFRTWEQVFPAQKVT